jgi:hypothetical protein
MHLVHTLVFWVFPPPLAMCTVFKLGSQRLLVLLCAWDTLLPVTGPLPQISHTFAMFFSFYPLPQPNHRQTVECMNGLLVNNESESGLLTSFLMISKYFYINSHALKRTCSEPMLFF